MSVGDVHTAAIAPETDEDWYGVHFPSTGWYSVHVSFAAPTFNHEMDPIVELYHPDHSFAASQELAGGDLLFQITVTGDYFVRVRNVNGSTASYSVIVNAVGAPPRFAPSLEVDFGTPAESAAIADVDGDGRGDALVAFGDTSQIPDTIAVFGQTPTRSLSLFAALPTDVMGGGGMATGDLDGDGKSDIAIPVNGGIDYFTNIGPSTVPVFISQPGVDLARDRRRRRRHAQRHRRGRFVRRARVLGPDIRDVHVRHANGGLERCGRQREQPPRRSPRRRDVRCERLQTDERTRVRGGGAARRGEQLECRHRQRERRRVARCRDERAGHARRGEPLLQDGGGGLAAGASVAVAATPAADRGGRRRQRRP